MSHQLYFPFGLQLFIPLLSAIGPFDSFSKKGDLQKKKGVDHYN